MHFCIHENVHQRFIISTFPIQASALCGTHFEKAQAEKE